MTYPKPLIKFVNTQHNITKVDKAELKKAMLKHYTQYTVLDMPYYDLDTTMFTRGIKQTCTRHWEMAQAIYLDVKDLVND